MRKKVKKFEHKKSIINFILYSNGKDNPAVRPLKTNHPKTSETLKQWKEKYEKQGVSYEIEQVETTTTIKVSNLGGYDHTTKQHY